VVVVGGPASARSASAPQYYVSLGDSYAAGYQPTSPKGGHTTTNGFAYQVTRLASAKGYHFTLVNFGCGGATTTSILKSLGCAQLGPGAPRYPAQTQAGAAEQFLVQHRGHVGLITVSIGGNDVTACASTPNRSPAWSRRSPPSTRTWSSSYRGYAGRRGPACGSSGPRIPT